MINVIALALFVSFKALANPYIIKHDTSETHLKIEILEDRGLHFEILTSKPKAGRIWTSPMVLQNPKLTPSSVLSGNTIKSHDFVLNIDKANLCISIKDLRQNWDFITTCPANIFEVWKGLSLYTNDAQNAYGLGAYYQNPGTADGDWVGKTWDPLSNTMGNALRPFSKGANSYAMFPVLYVQGTGLKNYMVLYDSVYKQMWTLNGNPWHVASFGDELRWFIFTDENVKKLRQKFMKLTGTPPVPPKSAFGMWISEFGFESWNEVGGEITSMRDNQLPLDGVALDLHWFGGEFFEGQADRSRSRFGTLQFDERNFPDPKANIAHLKNKLGIDLMLIEESYISKSLNEFNFLEKNGFLARDCKTMASTILSANPWWGIGGIIDWTNPGAGSAWHNLKRQKLYDLGVNFHWADLGEPEMYNTDSCYYGFPELVKHQHIDIHNIYNFKWIESMANGYKANNNLRRPFIMSRSGTIGLQRFGAAMWSGDIGANMGALTAHYNTQMHMSYSGMDYFGSDIGGFHRRIDTLDGNAEELYTQWFANAALFDFPVRAHTWNLANNLETSPSKIGDLASNRFNIKLRYKLVPYYYSLAHEAYLQGLPIIIPMAMEFPEDMKVRKMGNQKMIGQSLMAAMVASYGEKKRSVYLPNGEWIDFHTGQHFNSHGDTVHDILTEENGIFRLPLFIRKGGIIPMMKDMDERVNISGMLLDGSFNNDLTLALYPSHAKSIFVMYEDDGITTAYKVGKVSMTQIIQEIYGSQLDITLSGSNGQMKGVPVMRNLDLDIFGQKLPKSVQLNGNEIRSFHMDKGILKIQLGLNPVIGSTRILIRF